MIKYVETVEEFDSTISKGKTLVDFYAIWCGPCNMLTPVLEEMDEQGDFKDIKVVKVNVDDLMEIAERYSVYSIPTLILFEDGKVVKKTLGYQNKNQLLQFITK